MYENLVIEENTVYELDEECMKKKENKKQDTKADEKKKKELLPYKKD